MKIQRMQNAMCDPLAILQLTVNANDCIISGKEGCAHELIRNAIPGITLNISV